MVDVDKRRINALLADLRTWEAGDPPLCIDDLAKRHQLDPMIVLRIAQSEDVDVQNGDGVPTPVDEKADTGPVDVD